MRIIQKLFFYSCLIILTFTTGCSPAKKAQQQFTNLDALKNKMDSVYEARVKKGIADWLDNHPLICPEQNLDSLCGLYYQCPDNTIANNSNEYLPKDSTIKKPVAVPGNKPQRILVPFENKEQINFLKQQNTELETKLKECEAKAVGKKEATADIIPQLIKKDPWAFNNWTWLLIAIVGGGVIFTILKLKRKI